VTPRPASEFDVVEALPREAREIYDRAVDAATETDDPREHGLDAVNAAGWTFTEMGWHRITAGD
jgi:hypothetical protein